MRVGKLKQLNISVLHKLYGARVADVYVYVLAVNSVYICLSIPFS